MTRDVLFYLESFFFLTGFRQYGMAGPLPISLPDIAEYARAIGYTSGDDLLFFMEIVHACDMVYLKKVAEDSKPAPSGKPSRR